MKFIVIIFIKPKRRQFPVLILNIQKQIGEGENEKHILDNFT